MPIVALAATPDVTGTCTQASCSLKDGSLLHGTSLTCLMPKHWDSMDWVVVHDSIIGVARAGFGAAGRIIYLMRAVRMRVLRKGASTWRTLMA